MLQALTTLEGKEIYINSDYIFKMRSINNGTLIYTEVENFVLRNTQEIEVSETPTDLEKIIKECVFVTLLNGTEIYLNKKYIFKIIPYETFTEIYVSVKFGLNDYRVYEIQESIDTILSQYDTEEETRAFSDGFSDGFS